MTILDQASLIKFATLHCQRTTEIYEMSQEVYEDSTIHHYTILYWSQTFCQGQNNNEDNTHCGKLRTYRENISAAIIATILKEQTYDLHRDSYGIQNTTIICSPCCN
jgi:hypothetical protein